VNQLQNGGIVNRFTKTESGNVAITFALMLVPLCLFAGLAVDYSSAIAYRAKLQESADATALSAAGAAASGTANTAVLAQAQQVWITNSQMGNLSKSSGAAETIDVNTAYDVSTAKVSYSACVPTAFARIAKVDCLPIKGAATAQAYNSTIAKMGFNGSGSVWGDPHIVGADGLNTEIDNCVKGNWYDLLSDGGIEVNIACQPWAANGVAVVTAYTVVVGSHIVTYTFPDTALAQAGSGYWYRYDPVLTIDGVVQSIPSTPQPYLGGAVTFGRQSYADTVQGITATLPVLTVATNQYQLVMSFPFGGYIQITATAAGRCGTPGGIWGNTLAGNNNLNSKKNVDATSFQVDSATATVAGFKQTACSVASLWPRLIQ